jgi:hypothetical protein
LSVPCGFECVEGYYKFKNPFVLDSSMNLNLNVIEGLMSVGVKHYKIYIGIWPFSGIVWLSYFSPPNIHFKYCNPFFIYF